MLSFTVCKGAPSLSCLAGSESLLMTMMSRHASCLTPSSFAPSTPTMHRSDSEPDWEELRISITPPSVRERQTQWGYHDMAKFYIICHIILCHDMTICHIILCHDMTICLIILCHDMTTRHDMRFISEIVIYHCMKEVISDSLT